MFCVLLTKRAILIVFNPFRMLALVFGRCVVPLFTFSACKCYFLTHYSTLLPL